MGGATLDIQAIWVAPGGSRDQPVPPGTVYLSRDGPRQVRVGWSIRWLPGITCVRAQMAACLGRPTSQRALDTTYKPTGPNVLVCRSVV